MQGSSIQNQFPFPTFSRGNPPGTRPPKKSEACRVLLRSFSCSLDWLVPSPGSLGSKNGCSSPPAFRVECPLCFSTLSFPRSSSLGRPARISMKLAGRSGRPDLSLGEFFRHSFSFLFLRIPFLVRLPSPVLAERWRVVFHVL